MNTRSSICPFPNFWYNCSLLTTKSELIFVLFQWLVAPVEITAAAALAVKLAVLSVVVRITVSVLKDVCVELTYQLRRDVPVVLTVSVVTTARPRVDVSSNLLPEYNY